MARYTVIYNGIKAVFTYCSISVKGHYSLETRNKERLMRMIQRRLVVPRRDLLTIKSGIGRQIVISTPLLLVRFL